MNWNRYFKSNWSKILALLIVFAIIIFLGGLLFSWGYRFKKRTLLLRGSYMLIAVLWVVLSIRAICIKVHFGAIWRGLMNDIDRRIHGYEDELTKNYQDLISRYPLAVAEYESHCWRQTPRPTNSEIMESALAIDEREWIEREKRAREKVTNKNTARKS